MPRYELHSLSDRPSSHSELSAPTERESESATKEELIAGVLALVLVACAIFLTVRSLYFYYFRKRRPKRSVDNEFGSSDLARSEEFKRWTQPPQQFDTALFVKDARGARWSQRWARLNLPLEVRNQHLLLVGKTGGGKTTRGILPLLYQDCLCPVRSTIVIDSKSEIWHLLAQMTRTYNPQKQLLLFNPLDRVRSLSWNILSKVATDTDAKLVATSIIAATDNPQAKADTPFFRNSALQLLNSIMVGLLNNPDDRLSMPRIHELVHSGKLELCDWLESNPEALRSSRTFIELARGGSQNGDTVLSELAMRISAWDISAVRATTFFNELDLDALILNPSLLVVELRESELEMLRPLANTIVVELLRFLTRRAEEQYTHRLMRPIGIVIDEFASALGRLPEIHVKLNTLRSRNISIVAAVQSLGQIQAAYGPEADNVVAGFGTKIFIPPLEQLDAEWASRESGTMTIRYSTSSRNRSRRLTDNFFHRDRGRQENVQQRAVLTPDEVARPADRASTFFLPTLPAFQGHLLPYFEIDPMNERIGIRQEELNIRPSPLLDPSRALEAGPPKPLLTYEGEIRPPDASAAFSEVLGEIRPHIRWERADAEAQEWWRQLEADNIEQLPSLILLSVELVRRKATLTELYRAYIDSEADSIEELLEALDHARNEAAAARAAQAPRYANESARQRAAWERAKRQRKRRRDREAAQRKGAT